MAKKTPKITKSEFNWFIGAVKAAGFKIFDIQFDGPAGLVKVKTEAPEGSPPADQALDEWLRKNARSS